MKHNFLTRRVLHFLEDVDTSLIIREPDFVKLRKISITAPKLIKVNWKIWL